MKRREFLKNGMTITVLAAASPFLLSGSTEAAAASGATQLYVKTSGCHATLLHSERLLVDYCTARSFKTPYFSQIAEERSLVIEL